MMLNPPKKQQQQQQKQQQQHKNNKQTNSTNYICFQKAATLLGGDQPSPAPFPMACHRVERLTGNFMPAAMLMRTASLQRLRYPLGGC